MMQVINSLLKRDTEPLDEFLQPDPRPLRWGKRLPDPIASWPLNERLYLHVSLMVIAAAGFVAVVLGEDNHGTT